VALVLLLTLGAVYGLYWRSFVYQPPRGNGGGGGGGGGIEPGPTIVAAGRADLAVTTLAGTGVPGYVDGRAGRAQFDGPSGVAADRTGSLFVADARNHRIRRITPAGEVTTVAGSGSTGDTQGGFADGPVQRSRFRCPAGVAVAADGTLYVADTGNHCIRRIRGGTVTTLAGGGGATAAGDGDGMGSAARFREPSGVAVDATGNIYVADTGNGAVRKVDGAGHVSTLARGGGLQAPTGVAVAAGGTLLVTDPRAGRVFRISPAGGGQPPAPVAFALPEQVAPQQPAGAGTAPDGTAVVADLGRQVLFAEQGGEVYLLAGAVQSEGIRSGSADGPGDKASFDHPFGVTADAAGVFYVADYANQCIRRIGPPLADEVGKR
jgi:sugar lactone lactonase YvrE